MTFLQLYKYVGLCLFSSILVKFLAINYWNTYSALLSFSISPKTQTAWNVRLCIIVLQVPEALFIFLYSISLFRLGDFSVLFLS